MIPSQIIQWLCKSLVSAARAEHEILLHDLLDYCNKTNDARILGQLFDEDSTAIISWIRPLQYSFDRRSAKDVRNLHKSIYELLRSRPDRSTALPKILEAAFTSSIPEILRDIVCIWNRDHSPRASTPAGSKEGIALSSELLTAVTALGNNSRLRIFLPEQLENEAIVEKDVIFGDNSGQTSNLSTPSPSSRVEEQTDSELPFTPRNRSMLTRLSVKKFSESSTTEETQADDNPDEPTGIIPDSVPSTVPSENAVQPTPEDLTPTRTLTRSHTRLRLRMAKQGSHSPTPNRQEKRLQEPPKSAIVHGTPHTNPTPKKRSRSRKRKSSAAHNLEKKVRTEEPDSIELLGYDEPSESLSSTETSPDISSQAVLVLENTKDEKADLEDKANALDIVPADGTEQTEPQESDMNNEFLKSPEVNTGNLTEDLLEINTDTKINNEDKDHSQEGEEIDLPQPSLTGESLQTSLHNHVSNQTAEPLSPDSLEDYGRNSLELISNSSESMGADVSHTVTNPDIPGKLIHWLDIYNKHGNPDSKQSYEIETRLMEALWKTRQLSLVKRD